MRKYRAFSPVSVGTILQKITPQFIPKNNYMLGTLSHEWSTIVGDTLAALSHPSKISFAKGQSKEGTLYLTTRDNSTSMMLYHQQNSLIEKVNVYLGYKACTGLVIRIGHTPTHPLKKKRVYEALSDHEKDDITQTLSVLPEGSLKESLRQLGTTLREVMK